MLYSINKSQEKEKKTLGDLLLMRLCICLTGGLAVADMPLRPPTALSKLICLQFCCFCINIRTFAHMDISASHRIASVAGRSRNRDKYVSYLVILRFVDFFLCISHINIFQFGVNYLYFFCCSCFCLFICGSEK